MCFLDGYFVWNYTFHLIILVLLILQLPFYNLYEDTFEVFTSVFYCFYFF